MQSDLARVEYWGTLGEWIERADGPAEEHLAKVSRTVRDAQPAIPRSARLDGPLESLLELLTDGLVERPRPGGGVEAARSVLQDDCSTADNGASCEVCGESGSGATAAAAVAADSAECDCEACNAEAAAEAAATAQPPPPPPLSLQRASTQAYAGSSAIPRGRGGSDDPPGAAAPPSHPDTSAALGQAPRDAAEGAAPDRLSGPMEPVGACREAAHAGSVAALSTVDLEDDGCGVGPGDGRAQLAHVSSNGVARIMSLERAVGGVPGSPAAQRRQTMSHYVARSTPMHAGVEAVPMAQDHCLQVGGPAAGVPSLHAELARRSRAAVSELRREGSRSRTPEGGRRRVTV